jgi:DNA-binding transcriptional LysR family regulator
MQQPNSGKNVDSSSFTRYHWYLVDTRFLESFIAVVDNGSIAEAARRLDLTPAAVAKRIRALEHQIGARLVASSGRVVRSTEAGVAILDRARSFLAEARDLKLVATNRKPSGEFRLGALTSAVSEILPDLMMVWTEKYPQVELRLIRATSAILYHRVLDGDLDAAIMAEPPFAIPKTCDWRLLREEPLIVLTSAQTFTRDPHHLLKTEPFIRIERTSWAGRLIDGYLRGAGIQPHERFELTGIDLIAVLVDRGLGVTLMHDSGPMWLKGLAVTKITVPKNAFARRIGLLWSSASARIQMVNTFLDEAVPVFARGTAASSKKIKNRNTAGRR